MGEEGGILQNQRIHKKIFVKSRNMQLKSLINDAYIHVYSQLYDVAGQNNDKNTKTIQGITF